MLDNNVDLSVLLNNTLSTHSIHDTHLIIDYQSDKVLTIFPSNNLIILVNTLLKNFLINYQSYN